MSKIEVFPDAAQLAQAAASRIVERALDAVQKHRIFSFVLAGGSTPRAVYTLLATEFRERFPWQQTHFFWGDERCVPPDHRDSNYRMAADAMLSRVAVPAENIHRIRTELPDVKQVAQEYSAEITKYFDVGYGIFPRFDLILLGLGPDGHTASLFPDSAVLNDNQHLVVENWVQKFGTYRITMTFPLLNQAHEILFLVEGAEKREVLRKVLQKNEPYQPLPAQRIQPADGTVVWFVDRAAAEGILI